MNKLLLMIFTVSVLAVLLVMATLFYIDMTAHKGFTYELYRNGSFAGKVNIEKYTTENKIVYRIEGAEQNTLDYPFSAKKLVFDKSTGKLLNFEDKQKGVCGGYESTVFINGGHLNYYMAERDPYFYNSQSGYIRNAEFLLLPDDPALAAVFFEKYNFWRKGLQQFIVLTAYDSFIAPAMVKAEIWHEGEEYINIMGKRVQAEKYKLDINSFPEITVYVSTVYHEVLTVENNSGGFRMELVHVKDSSFEKLREKAERLLFSLKKSITPESKELMPEHGENVKERVSGAEHDYASGPGEQSTVYIDNGENIISANLSVPSSGPILANIVLLPDGGPMRRGEELYLHTYRHFFNSLGFSVLSFECLIKEQGSAAFNGLSDELKVRTVLLALENIEKNSGFPQNSIFCGRGGGSYIALRSALEYRNVSGEAPPVILFGLSWWDGVRSPEGISREFVTSYLKEKGVNTDMLYSVPSITERTRDYLKDIVVSQQDILSFKGKNLSLQRYRDFLQRDLPGLIKSYKGPIFLALPDEQVSGGAGIYEELSSREESTLNIAVFPGADEYLVSRQDLAGKTVYGPYKALRSKLLDWIRNNTEYADI
jgi:hypothetical protein